MNRKKIFKWTCIALGVMIVLTFFGRIIYEYRMPNTQSQGLYYTDNYISTEISGSNELRNYANTIVDYEFAPDGTKIDQQYEKIADLSSVSKDFEKDEATLYEGISRNNCIVQLEEKHGLPGERVTSLTLGVKPDNFDNTVKELSTIGTIISTQTTKTDKTADYKNLLAGRATLEKTKESYVALREKGGTLAELMSLEEKIIEVEGELQAQDVSLSDFTMNEGLCTVNFILSEGSSAINARSFGDIVVSSAAWTAMVWLAVLGLVVSVMLSVCVLLLLIRLGAKVYSTLIINNK